MDRGTSQIRKRNNQLHRDHSQDIKRASQHFRKTTNFRVDTCIKEIKDVDAHRTKSPLKKFLQLRLGKHYSNQLKDMMQLL